MATKRFKILDGALDYLRTTDEGVNPDAPTGTPLKLYQDWKKGARNVTYERTAASKPGELLTVSIVPFGLAEADTAGYRVPLSLRAKNNIPGTNTLVAANIQQDVPPGADDAYGFVPAKATITVPSGTNSTAEVTSKLTGVKYAPSNTVSYTIPMGQKTTTTREIRVREAILAAVSDVAGVGVSFTSEKL